MKTMALIALEPSSTCRAATVCRWLSRDWLSLVHPVDARIVVGLGVTDGYMKPWTAVSGTGLEEQDVVAIIRLTDWPARSRLNQRQQ